MDLQSEKTPGLHLPQPSANKGMAFRAQYEEMPQKVETFNVSPEHSASMTPVSPPAAAIPQSAPMTIPIATDDAQTAQHQATPLDDSAVADDLDEEWINKAKMIVERTKDDPYMQSNEISKAKADYLRIRYNKHIKAAQSQSS